MKTLQKIGFVLFIVLPFLGNAQQNGANKIIEAIIESQLAQMDEQTDVALIIEDLEGFAENPININATTADELSRLYVLNSIQIKNLLQYLAEFGPAFSIYELNTINGISRDELQKIQPFVWFGPRQERVQKLGDAFRYGKNQLLLRSLGTLQEARGYQPKEDGSVPYEGNRFRYYTRYRYEARNRFSAGFTAEKDPGESFFNASNKNGFDFYSAHISLNFKGIFENVTAGDFLARAGQGLVLWQGYTSGKSESVLEISKTNQGIRPSTSVAENLFFRGGATTLKLGNAKLGLFYSHQKADGNVDESQSFFTSLQTSGYHRTQSEIEDKNAVKNENRGAIFNYTFSHLKVGATFVQQQFNMPFIPSRQLYNQFRFSGTSNYTGGADYLFSKGKYQLFGEAAISKSGGKAVLQGAVARLNDQLSFSALFRHFDTNYHALWANTFAEGSNINNESGLYFGAKLLPVKYVTLSAYSDVYRSKWISYSTAAPSTGWDVFAQAEIRPSRNFNFYLRFKNEEKEQKFKLNKRYVNLPERTQKLRLHFNYRPNENLGFKTRLEHVYYKGENSENGFMAFQDLQFAPKKIPLKLSVRLAYFNTESYNSRIYAYENDLLYTFSIPAFYGKGFRGYLNLRYQISEKLDFWFKVANTGWNDRETISSGYNEISGSNKTELKCQLRLKI